MKHKHRVHVPKKSNKEHYRDMIITRNNGNNMKKIKTNSLIDKILISTVVIKDTIVLIKCFLKEF